MKTPNIVIFKNDTITLYKTEKRGFWLWDETRKINLSVSAVNEQAAFVECIMYYQQRLKEVESNYHAMQSRLHAFMEGEGWEEVDQDKNDFCTSYK